MSFATSCVVTVMLIWITIHTISYAVWNWKHENKQGAFVVMLVCAAMWVLPVYLVIFRT